ncbi:MAG: NUDIX domain-containing protein [archaeon]
MPQDTLQIIVFRKIKDNYEFLLLKRIPKRGGFWQTLSGRLEKEEPLEGAKRELKEETGITETKRTIKLSDYPNGQEAFTEYALAFEVSPKTEINLNQNIYPEHDELKWLNINEAIELAQWPQYKKALKELNIILEK